MTYYTMLCYTILYYTILYYTILYYSILCTYIGPRAAPLPPGHPRAQPAAGQGLLRKGTNGVSPNGVTAIFMFSKRDFLGTPVTGRTFFPQSVNICYFYSGPISVDPICPQPNPVKRGKDTSKQMLLLMMLVMHDSNC